MSQQSWKEFAAEKRKEFGAETTADILGRRKRKPVQFVEPLPVESLFNVIRRDTENHTEKVAIIRAPESNARHWVTKLTRDRYVAHMELAEAA